MALIVRGAHYFLNRDASSYNRFGRNLPCEFGLFSSHLF